MSDVHLSNVEDRLVWRWSDDRNYIITLGIQGPALRFTPHPGLQAHLANPGAAQGQDLSMVSGEARTVDPKRRYRIDAADHCFLCDQELRDNRPHHRLILILKAGMVEHPASPRRRRITCRRADNVGLVELMAGEMERGHKARSTFTVHARCSGTLEGAQQKVLPRGNRFRAANC